MADLLPTGGVESSHGIQEPFDQLYDPHKKAQDAIDHAREVREQKIADRRKTAAEPHLITDGSLRRCSVCGYPFPEDIKPSMSVAFAKHLSKAHQPGQNNRTTE